MALAPEIAALLRCPRCPEPRPGLFPCPSCGWEPRLAGTIVDALGESPAGSGEVAAFYDRHAFPGYAPGETAATLLDRTASNPFVSGIDRNTPLHARVLDCGCGTGQIAMALALRAPGRTVVAADLSLGQLRVAEEFRDRCKIENVHLLRADLFSLPLARGAFDVVISRGVVHHTPAPLEAIRSVASYAAPGGMVVLGYYDRFGRLWHAIRRGVARGLGRPIRALDPILRRGDLDEDKKQSWIADQYHHPLEKSLTLGAVWHELEAAGCDWIGTVPSRGGPDEVAEPAAPGRAAMLARELGWMAGGFTSEDAGLVCVLARRRRDSGSSPQSRT